MRPPNKTIGPPKINIAIKNVILIIIIKNLNGPVNKRNSYLKLSDFSL